MVAPALLCGSLLGGLPAITIVAVFAATVFRNSSKLVVLEPPPEAAAPVARHLALLEAAPFLLFLALLVADFIVRVTHDRQVCALEAEREDALVEARQCRAEAEPLETPETYSQAAKLQRKALMREKHAEQLEQLKRRRSGAAPYQLLRSFRVAAPVAYVVWCWGAPALSVEPHLLAPLQDALALVPGRLAGAAGMISGPAWAYICLAASRRFAALLESAV